MLFLLSSPSLVMISVMIVVVSYRYMPSAIADEMCKRRCMSGALRGRVPYKMSRRCSKG